MVCQNLPWEMEKVSQSISGEHSRQVLPAHPPLTAGDFSSTKPSSGLHSAATKLPLGRGGSPARSHRPARQRGPPTPRPAPSQALHSLLGQQLPELLTALAQPLGLSRRAIGEEVLGTVRPLGQLLGPRAGGEELRGAGGEGEVKSALCLDAVLPGSGPRFPPSTPCPT